MPQRSGTGSARVPASTSASRPADRLAAYWAKRDFSVTTEPRGEPVADAGGLTFVVQKHAASRLHYDFRLELDGVLVSWALPKGPSFDPSDKRMAIHVEDHPLAYASFEGTIAPKQYGAGTVIVWDRGHWAPVGDPHEGMAAGKLVFDLHGEKLQGRWELVRIAKGGERQEPWLLFKKRDAFARPKSDYDVVTALPDSVIAKPLGKSRPAAKRASGKAPGRRDAGVPGAVVAPLPEKLSPQLATLASSIPSKGEWLYEIKFDGYRIMCRIDNQKARLITRGGHDWSAKMPALVAQIESLGIRSAWLDGEIVVLDEHGAPSFNALQKAFDQRRNADIRYFLFDVPYLEGHDLRGVALSDRRALLEALLGDKGNDKVRFSAAFDTDPQSILRSACQLNLEGVIAKRADAPYVSRRTDTWLKLKCKLRQEFVIAGYTERSDGRVEQIGSLVLGVHEGRGELVSVGSVGTGWDVEEATRLKSQLERMEVPEAPFAAGAAQPGRWTRRLAGSERWVAPRLVAEVEFAEWTPDGQIRHATYLGLRSDKPAASVVRETAAMVGDAAVATAVPTGSTARKARKVIDDAVRITHGERVIDASTGLTKRDLVRYYESVADWILPHLRSRPVSLVRAPEGVAGPQFFQKHGERIGIPGVGELPPDLWPGHEPLLEVASARALVGCAQMNVVELHTWNSTKKKVRAPDRMVFDLDPGEGTDWQQVQEAATLVRALLHELQLESWLKTSGGKGLHVVVPLAARLDYDTVKSFSQAIVLHLAKTIPSRFVAKSGPANRVGKLFVDYLRNGFGATTAAAFSARARPGLGVSMPVSWDELPNLKGGAHWTIATAREHLSFQKVDPWADYWSIRQSLSPGMKALGFKPPPAAR